MYFSFYIKQAICALSYVIFFKLEKSFQKKDTFSQLTNTGRKIYKLFDAVGKGFCIFWRKIIYLYFVLTARIRKIVFGKLLLYKFNSIVERTSQLKCQCQFVLYCLLHTAFACFVVVSPSRCKHISHVTRFQDLFKWWF